jgi:LemA protein
MVTARGAAKMVTTFSEEAIMRVSRWLTIGLMLVSVTLGGCGYNRLVTLREAIDGAWAQVENQLQRRNDLVPNLVEVTKGYAKHEREIFESVANARARMLSAGSRDDKIAAAGEMSSALSRLLALSERYPDLKANQQFARLSDELAGTENRIATERRRYNDTVREYNTLVRSFPTMLTARATGFEPQKDFEAPEAAQQVPTVKFE